MRGWGPLPPLASNALRREDRASGRSHGLALSGVSAAEPAGGRSSASKVGPHAQQIKMHRPSRSHRRVTSLAHRSAPASARPTAGTSALRRPARPRPHPQRRGARPAPGGQPGARADARLHPQGAVGAGRDRQGAGVRRDHAGRQGAHGQRAGDDRRAGHRQAADRRRPLRHQAVQGRLVRRGERRRIEHRFPDRAGAGPEAVAALDSRRAAVSRRRGGRAPRVARSGQPLRQPLLRRERQEGRHAASRSPRWCWST